MSEIIVAGRYQIVRGIGRGAFGGTFLAHDRVSYRSVALKLLDRRGDVDLKALELFEREASVLRSMRIMASPRYLTSCAMRGTAPPGRFSSWSTSRVCRSAR